MVKEEKMIQMVDVKSSFIREIGYSSKTKELIITMDNKVGIIFLYKYVPEEVYDDFINSDSKGAFFSNNIKNIYECSKKYCGVLSAQDFYYNLDTKEIIDNRNRDIIPITKREQRKIDTIINKIESLTKENKLSDNKLNQLLKILGE